jgi:hypothetical protein
MAKKRKKIKVRLIKVKPIKGKIFDTKNLNILKNFGKYFVFLFLFLPITSFANNEFLAISQLNYNTTFVQEQTDPEQIIAYGLEEYIKCDLLNGNLQINYVSFYFINDTSEIETYNLFVESGEIAQSINIDITSTGWYDMYFPQPLTPSDCTGNDGYIYFVFTKTSGDYIEKMGGDLNANIPDTTFQDYMYDKPEASLAYKIYQLSEPMIVGLNLILIGIAIWFGNKFIGYAYNDYKTDTVRYNKAKKIGGKKGYEYYTKNDGSKKGLL